MLPRNRCVVCVVILLKKRKKCIDVTGAVPPPAGITDVHWLETNENLRIKLDSMQMPTVEYKEITIDDYSTEPSSEPHPVWDAEH